MSASRLLVLTGMDGAGKTLQARRLVGYLEGRGVAAEYLWCRGRNLLSLPFIVLGRRLHRAPKTHLDLRGDDDRRREAAYQRKKKSLLRSPLIRGAWTCAVLTERLIELSFRVRSARRRAEVVVCDRYLFDSLVDLATDLGEPAEVAARRLTRWYCRLLPKPDTVALLDLDPETAFARKSDIPSVSYLAARRALYRRFAQAGGWTLIDAADHPEAVTRALLAATQPLTPDTRHLTPDTRHPDPPCV
jgi:dTMP kinase